MSRIKSMNFLSKNPLNTFSTQKLSIQMDFAANKNIENLLLQSYFVSNDTKNKKMNEIYKLIKLFDLLATCFSLTGLFLMGIEV